MLTLTSSIVMRRAQALAQPEVTDLSRRYCFRWFTVQGAIDRLIMNFLSEVCPYRMPHESHTDTTQTKTGCSDKDSVERYDAYCDAAELTLVAEAGAGR